MMNGALVLTDIHGFQYSTDTGELGSVDNSAGSYMNAINAVIIGESALVVVVPEPSIWLALLAVVAGGCFRYCRSRMVAHPI